VQEQPHSPPEDGVATTVPAQSLPLPPSAAGSTARPPPVSLPTVPAEPIASLRSAALRRSRSLGNTNR
jgi:hypothetical protein